MKTNFIRTSKGGFNLLGKPIALLYSALLFIINFDLAAKFAPFGKLIMYPSISRKIAISIKLNLPNNANIPAKSGALFWEIGMA